MCHCYRTLDVVRVRDVDPVAATAPLPGLVRRLVVGKRPRTGPAAHNALLATGGGDVVVYVVQLLVHVVLAAGARHLVVMGPRAADGDQPCCMVTRAVGLIAAATEVDEQGFDAGGVGGDDGYNLFFV